MIYECVQGDIEVPLPIALVDLNCCPVNVSDMTAIHMNWLRPDLTTGTLALAPVSAIMGTFQHAWSAGETDVPGVHRGQVVVTRAGGDQQTFPMGGSYYRWIVHPTLP